MSSMKLFRIGVILCLPLLRAAPSHMKRPTLHELLKKNQNIASVPHLIPGHGETNENPNYPSKINNNSNRRSLVLDGGNDVPNYVYNDEISDDNIDSPDHDQITPEFQGQLDKYTDNVFKKLVKDGTVGDAVTQEYAKNYGVNLPSYADPNFLTAVMNQADEANFRYPIENKGAVIVGDKDLSDLSMSESARVETYSDSKPPELNPYELFPPSFHELLDIPIHVYPNGTSYNPHQKFKNSISSHPTITKGYTNTNINGNNKISKNKASEKEKPKRISTRIKPSFPTPTDRFESKRVKNNQKSTVTTTTTSTTTTTTNSPIQITKQSERRINRDFVNSKRNFPDKESENRLPSNTRTKPSNTRTKPKIKPIRPSLKFRTTLEQNPTRNMYTTTPLTTKVVTETFSTPLTTEIIDNRYGKREEIQRHENNIYKPQKKTYPLEEGKEILREIQEVKRPVKPKRPIKFINENENKRKPSDFIPSYFQGFQRDLPFFEDSLGLKPFDQSSFFNPTFNEKKDRKKVKVSPPVEENFFNPFKSFSNEENFSPSFFEKTLKDSRPQKKMKSKHEFSPSERVPHFRSEPLYLNPVSDKKSEFEKVIIPTTFRPLHSLSLERENPIPTTYRPFISGHHDQSSFEKEFFKPLHEIHEQLFDSSGFDDEFVPFTNSHSLIKPLQQYNLPNSVEKRQKPQLERGVPVYISSPIRRTAQFIQKEFDVFDEHPALSVDLKPPPTYEYQSSPQEDHYSYEFSPNRRIYSTFDDKRERSSRKRPSFFEKLGLFKPREVNRSGFSDSKSNILQSNKEDSVINGQKVVVIGPFKEPPIGAPSFFSENDEVRDLREALFQVPSPSIESLRKTESPEDFLYKDSNTPLEPRRFRLPSNNFFDINQSRDIVVQSQFEVGDESQIDDVNRYRKGSVDSVNRFYASPNVPVTPTRASSQSNSIKQSKPLVRSAVQVNSKNYNLFEEVSEEDKNKLIAAKFQIPRISPVRRSGLQRHMIPIPVPLMTPEGKQILNFHNIEVPHSPVVKKQGKILSPKMYNDIEKMLQPTLDKTIKQQKKHQFADEGFLPVNMKAKNSNNNYEDFVDFGPPQSYREPSVSQITFGGWQAVGGSSPAEKSYIKERSPFLLLEEQKNKSKGEYMDEHYTNNNEEMMIKERE